MRCDIHAIMCTTLISVPFMTFQVLFSFCILVINWEKDKGTSLRWT